MENTKNQKFMSTRLMVDSGSRIDRFKNYQHGALGTFSCKRRKLISTEKLPLDWKLPYYAFSKELYLFSRGKPGDPLYPKEELTDFRLYDMDGYILHQPYEALHDPHLKEHFQKPIVQKDLKKAKLVDTEMNYAICSLLEANKFRLSRRMLNLQYAQNALLAADRTREEEKRIEEIQINLSRNEVKRGQEAAEEKRRNFVLLEEMKKQHRFLEMQKLWRKKIRDCEVQKSMEMQKRRIVSEDKSKMVLQRIEGVKSVKEAEYLMMKRRLRERDERRERRKTRLEKIQLKLKDEEMVRKCLAKINECRKRQVEYEVILGLHEKAYIENVEKRKKQHELQLDDQRERLKLKRGKEVREKLKADYRKKLGVEISGKFSGRKDWETIKYLFDRWMAVNLEKCVEKPVKVTLLELEEYLEKSLQTPSAVIYVLDDLLENVIINHVGNLLMPILEKAKESGVRCCMVKYDRNRTSAHDIRFTRRRSTKRSIMEEYSKSHEALIDDELFAENEKTPRLKNAENPSRELNFMKEESHDVILPNLSFVKSLDLGSHCLQKLNNILKTSANLSLAAVTPTTATATLKSLASIPTFKLDELADQIAREMLSSSTGMNSVNIAKDCRKARSSKMDGTLALVFARNILQNVLPASAFPVKDHSRVELQRILLTNP